MMPGVLRVVVHGTVQGVGFRFATVESARHLDLRGWVRNLHDGGVEAHLEGPHDRLDAMVRFLRNGPPGARVERCVVTVDVPADDGLAGFEVRRDGTGLSGVQGPCSK